MKYLENIFYKNCNYKIRACSEDHIIYLNKINYSKLVDYLIIKGRKLKDFKFGISHEYNNNLYRVGKDIQLLDYKVKLREDIFLDIYNADEFRREIRKPQVIGQLELRDNGNRAPVEDRNEINFEAIENALGFNLNDKQKIYLKQEVFRTSSGDLIFWNRQEGFTTVYILAMLMCYNDRAIDRNNIGDYSDRENDLRYSIKTFPKMFFEIRQKLLQESFYLREVI